MKISFSFLIALSVSLFLIGCGPFATDNKTASTNASVGNQTNHNVSTSNQTNGSANNNTNNNGSTGNYANATNITLPRGRPTENKSVKYVCSGGGEIVQGYQLPPCPDEKENDKTLLGIDSNNNGVRDDVEIWIYHTYDTYQNCTEVEVEGYYHSNGNYISGGHKDVCTDEMLPYHQIVREVAMQYARAYQIVIQEPEKAKETEKFENAAGECEAYFQYDAKRRGEPLLIPNKMHFYREMDKVQFNTLQRARAYHKYNFYLSGTFYSPPHGSLKRFCDFDVNKLLGK